MEILLIYPADGIRFFQSMVPLGMLSIATFVRDAGFDVHMIDMNHYRGNLEKDLKEWKPRIIGIGGTTPSRIKSFRIAGIVKKVLPESTVVYGGVNATFTAKEVLEQIPAIDYVIMGEGEHSFKELCISLLRSNGKDQDTLSGLAFRQGSDIRMNPQKRIQDLSELPVPDRGLVKGNYRLDMDFIPGRSAPIITSRGCPAMCNFCSASRMFPGGVRFRLMNQVREEVTMLLEDPAIAGFKVFDSTFTSDRNHVLSFCEMIRPFNKQWECEIRADTVDYELLKTMKEAGCYYVNMGLESADEQRLRKISKGISTNQALQVMADCRDLGILVKVFFTFGHPGQTYAECMEDVRFIRKYRKSIDFYAVTPGLRIYPGTRLEKEAREIGFLPHNFSWITSRPSPKNFLFLEFNNTFILFQKQLGALRLLRIALILFFSGLYSSREFMGRMIAENLRYLFKRNT